MANKRQRSRLARFLSSQTDLGVSDGKFGIGFAYVGIENTPHVKEQNGPIQEKHP